MQTRKILNMQRSILRKRIRARLVTTATLLRALTNKFFVEKGFEITPEQYSILSLLADNKVFYQRQLSEITLKDRANISRILNILEEKELVKRSVDSNGRQIFKIEITPKGLEMYEKIEPVAIQVRQIATRGIKKDELEICLNTLDKMFNNLEDKVNMQI